MRIKVLLATSLQVILKSGIAKDLPRRPDTYLHHAISDLIMAGLQLYTLRASDDPQPLLHVGYVLGELHLDMVHTTGEPHDTAPIAVGIEMEQDEADDPEMLERITNRTLCDFRDGCIRRKPDAVDDIVFGPTRKLFCVSTEDDGGP